MIKKKNPKLSKPCPVEPYSVGNKIKSEDKEKKSLRRYETLDTRAPIGVQF